jgi:hypothetical protein
VMLRLVDDFLFLTTSRAGALRCGPSPTPSAGWIYAAGAPPCHPDRHPSAPLHPAPCTYAPHHPTPPIPLNTHTQTPPACSPAAPAR